MVGISNKWSIRTERRFAAAILASPFQTDDAFVGLMVVDRLGFTVGLDAKLLRMQFVLLDLVDGHGECLLGCE